MWQKIATQVQNLSTKGTVTAASVRLRVALNRGGLLEKLGVKPVSSIPSIKNSLIDKVVSKLFKKNVVFLLYLGTPILFEWF